MYSTSNDPGMAYVDWVANVSIVNIGFGVQFAAH